MIIYNDLICGDYTDYNDQNMIQFLGILTITNQYHGKYHNILGIIKYQYNGMIEGFWTLLNVWYIYLHDWVSLGHMLVYIYIYSIHGAYGFG